MNERSVSGEQSSPGLITTIAGSSGVSEAFRAMRQEYPTRLASGWARVRDGS